MKKAAIVLFLTLCLPCFAGSSTAYLVCKSASGRTLFTAELGDITTFNEATFTVDGKSLVYGTDLCSAIIFDAKNKVFSISLDDRTGEAWLNFYAIPSSFVEIKDGKHDQHYKFKAIIQGKDPRPENFQTPPIELDCELTYSI